ncbi:MAG: M24 family metallopeptidase, partial [Deltaproteobacteria bacterium]
WVAARVEFLLRQSGCSGPAYGTIAAGGRAATILHYVRNDRKLQDGELLLLDAGGEFGGYAADVTRTMPVGRTFSAAQAQLYDTVVAAQQAAIDAAVPEAAHERVHQAAVEVLVDGMIDAGLLEGSRAECIEKESFKRFYMHGTSHWLGMDVHDAGDYRRGDSSRPLEPGMVLTVEPGIYVPVADDIPERFRGIGIRVEDDVLITPSGHEVLSEGLPKQRDEIERVRGRALS